MKSCSEKVKVERKRNFKHTQTGAKKIARKKMKEECRTINLEAELEKVKDGTIVTAHEAAMRKSVAGLESLS